MSLYDKIITLYPDISNDAFGVEGLIKLRNDGDGDYIEEWNHPTLAQPTQEQLDAVGEE